MRKSKSRLIYVLVSIVYFLIIPEIVLRVVSTDHLGRISDFTSLGGVMNPLLSLLIFLGLSSVILAILTVLTVRKLYLALSQPERH